MRATNATHNILEETMKTATIPSLRVDPELRHAVEHALHDNETISSFVVESLKAQVKRRRLQKEFMARGLASREEAKQTLEYFDADTILDELGNILISKEHK